MVPFLSLASDGVEGRIGRHQRRVRHTAAGQNPRWCHATHGTAAQDKAHFMDCSRGSGPRHEKLFESGDGHYTNGFHLCRWQETPSETRGTGVAKRAGLRYARGFRHVHATATTRHERCDTVGECVRGEASVNETWSQHDGLPIKPPSKPLQTDERRVRVGG